MLGAQQQERMAARPASFVEGQVLCQLQETESQDEVEEVGV